MNALNLAIVTFFALILFLLEHLIPNRKPKAKLLSRLAVNAAMGALTFLIAGVLVMPLVHIALDMGEKNAMGLLSGIRQYPWIDLLAGFLLLDLSFYYWHRLNHKVPFMWRFHNVHHFDPDLDVSTSFRFHFVEIAYSSIFRLFQIIIIGPNLKAFMVYEMAFQFASFFQHSNVRLPPRFDKLLVLFIVTPKMHETHHSDIRDETNSNYSVVFSFWDRLHATYKSLDRKESINIGVPGYDGNSDNTLHRALLAPFRKQRDYWQGRISRPCQTADIK